MRLGRTTGTNILVDDHISRKIAECVNITGKNVLEIGPGYGAITKHLKGYKKLYLIELQGEFEPYLRSKFPDSEIIIGDALKLEWPEFDVFISNLPYNISTPILEKLENMEFQEGVITVQKEVADRILANPGNKYFSRISVGMQLRFNIQKCFHISPHKFRPVPKVYSTVLRIVPKGVTLPSEFEDFLRTLFSSRRKMISTIFHDRSLPDKRPEELNPEELLELFKKISGQQS